MDSARLVYALTPIGKTTEAGDYYDFRNGVAVPVTCDVARAMGAKWYLAGWRLGLEGTT